jgi:hypothetical protein
MNDQQRAAAVAALNRAKSLGLGWLSIATDIGWRRVDKFMTGEETPTAYEAQRIEKATKGVIARHEIRPDLFDPPKRPQTLDPRLKGRHWLEPAAAILKGACPGCGVADAELHKAGCRFLETLAERAPASTVPQPARKVVKDGKARSRRQAEKAGGKEEGGEGKGRDDEAGRVGKGRAKR